jgi:amino acid adenylation domain-containing protein/non-ribosomal peptide synthase protein (TIGR01720 family)
VIPSAVEELFAARASYAQRRLWLLSQLEPANSAFHICAAVTLHGSLDVPRLAAALQHVVDRHESLRTTFTQENGEPLQVIAPSLSVPIPVEDAHEDDVEAIARSEFDTPFSLLRGPLLRVRLLRLGPDRHVLLSVLHHIIADGWSMGLLVDEIVRLYRGESLPPLTLQYADFAEWQQELLSGPRLEKLLAYWTDHLRGAPALTPLPNDRPRPANRTFAAAAHRFTIEQPLAVALAQLAASHGATPFMTLLASFALLLHRYGAGTDLTVGTPVANRRRRELEPLIGMFVNTLALRVDLSGNPTFRELLGRVRRTALDAYDHQDLPFERVVEALQPGRSTSHTPLFQTMFVLQNAPAAEPAFDGLQLEPLPWGKSRTLFDLTITLQESIAGLGGSVEYSTELFDEATIAGLCRRFITLLTAIAGDPDRRLSQLTLLDDTDLTQLRSWGAARPAPAEQTIPELFAAQVEATPDAIALVDGPRTLTYRELNARSSAIARDLLASGVRPNTPVAVVLERSIEQIAAILGILKAGAAYLALEPTWPAERIEALSKDAGAVRLPESATSEQLPLPQISPDHLAYISYTSGSTGVPKGVAVPHRAVVRLVMHADYVELDAAETVLCFAPLSFDASTLEIWGALLRGAKLIIAPTHASLDDLARCLRTHAVTTCWLSAGLFQAMVEEHLDDLARVRQVLAGGDVLSPRHVARFLQAAPGSTLVNGYGPTENTTFTCCHPLTTVPPSGSIPIGRPIPGTSVFIVDRNFELTPPGVPGELVTGGDGLAHAYHGRPALTAEAFVPNPFDPTPGSRLYRTGDLARWRPDGTVEFLGRLDQQAKIRGFRIEPGEVEAALTALPGVAEAAVAVRGDGSRKRLLAWVVPHRDSDLEAEPLRTALKQSLPDYLIPSAISFLPALPLNSNGKIDRAALAEPVAVPNEAILETPTQVRLAALWAELLQASTTPAPGDEFFASGGHSLLASQLVSRICREFGIAFTLRQVFETPVLRDQAAWIDTAQTSSPGDTLPRATRRDRLPLSHSQQRLWLLQQLDPHSTAYNVPVALRLRGVLDRPALTRSLQSIVDRHEILRTAFVLQDGEPVQSVAPALKLEVPLLTVTAEEAARRIEANAAHVFDLAQAPLLRVELLRLAPDEHILLTSMHHIICDGWSVGIFVAEWKALYAAQALTPLPAQYGDYAIWERTRVDSADRAYWTEQLRETSPFLNLPTDRRRSSATAPGASHRLEIPVALRSLSEQASTTPFMTALAAFGLLLSRYANQERVVIASAVANRHREDVEPLIGCFVNTLPLTVDTTGDPTFLDLLARVRSMALGAYAHQEVPFEQIVESLNLPREEGVAPLAQAGFALQTFSIPSLDLPGLQLELLPTEIRTSKAELTLMLNDRGSSLEGAIEYNAGLFDSDTIAAIGTGFTRLLTAAAAQPAERLSALLESSETGDLPLASVPENRSNLTRSQMLAWLGQRLRPEDPLYNIGICFNVPTVLDPQALHAALETLVRSSDALRTVFVETAGVPMQVVQPQMPVPLEILDLSASADPEADWNAWGETRVQRPYDLTRCCFDFALATLGPQRSVWYIGVHHLIGDGLAIALIFRRVSELYAQAVAGTLPQTVPLPAYQDHVTAERRQRYSRHYRAAEAFWKKQLERPAEPIPFYGRLARHQSPRVESLVFELGTARSQQLRGSTLSDFFGAMLCTLLHRISGAEEIAIGIGVHNRSTRQDRETIGHYMSVLPVRVPLTPEADTVPTLASRFSKLCFQAFRRAAYTVSNPPNRRTYEVFYNYQINTFPQFAGLPAETKRFFPGREEDSFALHITEYDQSGNIGVQMDFSAADFTPDQRQLTQRLFLELIDGFLANPETPVEALPLTAAAAPPQRVAYAAPAPVHSLFKEQVRRNPTAEAVDDGQRSLTYGELNEEAERLAAWLAMQGVGPEVRVALQLPRGIGQIIGVLGVLKAGGVYVPIDADLPLERIEYILADSGARVVVNEAALAATAPPRRSRPVLHPANAAYVIYTSGSTGRPKGVVVAHSALWNAFHAWRDSYQLDSSQRHLQMANFSFDVFTGDWIRALCSGGSLVLCPRDTLLAPDQLHHLIATGGIECAEFVPAVAAALTAHCHETGKRLETLRLCIAGSDTWTAAECHAMRSICGQHTRLINSYGVTEAAIDSSWYEGLHELSPDAIVPIGRPFANMDLLLLDRRLRPVPDGVPGELYIGGEGVARGYHGKPALTAERFVPHPEIPGARLYRTGDRARRLPSGDIDFLGRLDSQVKLRGYRVELPEIEAVLQSLPAVERAAVVVSGGGTRLVAWVQTDTFDAAALRTALASRLPEYMVPAAILHLPRLPLTPSGKVDRRALPDFPAEAAAAHHYTAPRNDHEARLAAIWAEVLRVPKVGIHDNFFEAGGHSLLATQIISRVNQAFAVSLPLRSLFEKPTIAEQALALPQSDGQAPQPTIPSVPRDASLLPSFGQERLWFLQQLEGASAAYNIPSAVRVRGPLDIDATRRAFTQILDRHEVLRTSFPDRDGRCAVVIAPNVTLDLPVIDACEADIPRYLAEEARYTFDLAKAPLFRARILRLAAQDHVVLLNLHHIVSDGWSSAIFISEFCEFYQGRTLPALAIQYADYAMYQRQRSTADVTFWAQLLEGAPPVLALPADRPRPNVQTFQGGAVPVEIPASVAARLRAFTHQANATLYMTLLTSFAALLSRYSNQSKIVIGSPVANRPLPEIEPLIGFFLNTLVLPVDAGGNPTFAELAGRVRHLALDVLARQDMPFEHLVDALHPERTLSHSPLFQVMFILQNNRAGSMTLPGLDVQPIETPSSTEKFDLTLSLTEEGDAIRGSLGYSRDLFDESTAARMAAHFVNLISAAVADPGQRLASLPLLAAAERHQILHDWNATDQPRPASLLIHEMVEAQADRSPEATALLFDDQALTYREYNARANQLAHRLRALGVGPEVRVGICVDRSFEMMIALLAVLKVGGAYVPLDTSYPADRIAFMLTDAEVAVLLTLERHLPGLPVLTVPVLCLDRSEATLDQSNPISGVTPENLAYIIYTSGSTGRPKGVMNAHRGVVNRLLWGQETFAMQPTDRIVQKTPIGFDVSVWEMFWPLFTGAALVIAKPGGHRDSAYLVDLIERHKVTMIHFVAPMLGSFLEEDMPRCRSLRRVLTSGEALSYEMQRRFFEKLTVPLNDLYGPTEAAIEVSHWECHPTSPLRLVPIGKPIANVRLYILDRNFEPVPVGVPGELYIGGIAVARGYWKRPGLSAQFFVPDPYSPDPGARMYRTGDGARYLPDGNIDFLGRLDQQIKIRGFRVELGEIETALQALAAVREVVVLYRDRQLVAYVIPSGEAPPDVPALREALGRTLPDYMIPAHFVFLDAFPIAPNGKLNRAALPAPIVQAAADQYEEPRTAAEHALCGIWAEVLGRDRVGVQDDFFAIGGDSISSTRIVARARHAGYRLTLKQIFQHHTVRALAAVAEPLEASPDAATVSPLGPLPLTPIQRRFLDSSSDVRHFNQAVLLETAPDLDRQRLSNALAVLLRRHDALRLRFSREERGWIQQVDEEPQPPVLQVFPLAELADRAAALQAAIDPENGPLWQAAWFDAGPVSPGRLLLIVHHLAVDGVSWRVLLDDLSLLLSGAALPERASAPFGVWAHWQAAYARTEHAQEERGYWQGLAQQKFAALPVDLAAGINTAGSTEQVTVEMDAPLQAQLQEALLGSVVDALCDWTGAPTALLELEGHGRGELPGSPDVSETAGWFTTAFPAAFAQSVSPELAIPAIANQLGTIPHRGAGFGLLALEGMPEPEVAFNYLGRFDEAFSQKGGGPLLGYAGESVGPMTAPGRPRPYKLEVTALVSRGKLRVTWAYSRNLHLRQTVERLAACALTRLRQTLSAPAVYESAYPLSPSQLGILLQSVARPGSGVYVEQAAWNLRGELDPQRLEAACRYAIHRHGALRTSFLWSARPEPLQAVHRTAEPQVIVENWQGRDANDLAAFRKQDRERGFSLEQAPLFRLSLLQTAADEWHLVATYHHLILDGWSLPLVLGDIMSAYRSDSPAPAPQAEYRDYIAWLRRQDLQTAAAFWRQVLAGFPEPTPLAVNEAGSTDAPAESGFSLDAPTTARLESRARAAGVTLNTLLQGAWALALSWWSGRGDVLFGQTVSGRPAALAGVDSMAGMFVNTVPVRCQVSLDQPLTAWLQSVQAAQSEAERFTWCSAAQIHGSSELSPAMPLYDSILVVENYPVDRVSATTAEGFEVLEAQAAGAHTAAALTLLVGPGERLTFHAAPGHGRWDQQRFLQLLDGLQVILHRMAEEVVEPLRQILEGLPAPPSHDTTPARHCERQGLPPRTVQELRLAAIWEDLLGVARVGVRDNFFALGGHSLLALRLADRYEAEFGRRLPLDALLQAPTIEALAERAAAAPAIFSPLVPLQAHSGKPPLFCIHPLGGNVLCYAELARLLKDHATVYGLQARGIELDEEPATDLDAMARDYTALVRSVQPRGPYTLLGYSFGGFVALRMAAMLRDQGEQVARVVLLDVPHPSVVPPEMARTDDSGLLVSLFAGSLELSVEQLRAMTREERYHFVFEQAREAGLVPPGMPYDRALRYFAISQANHHMEYQPLPCDFPITLIRATELAGRISPQPDLGWQSFAPDVTVLWSPGSHETMLNPPHVTALADLVAGRSNA